MTPNGSRIVLGGSVVDLCDAGDALDRIGHHLTAPNLPPLAVTSINLDHVHHFGAGADWTGTLEAQHDLAWLNLIDGAPLAAQAKRLTGRPWPRLAGSDLIGPILALCESRGTRVGFLGGAADTHSLVRDALAASHPALRLAGFWAPARDELRDPARSAQIAAEIRDAGTELLIVGLGKPRQELWIAEHGVATDARVLLAFGAVVDFLAGRVDRAPHWMSAHGLEWAWRLALEPRRLSERYLVQGPRAYLSVRRTAPLSAAAGSTAQSSTAADSAPAPGTVRRDRADRAADFSGPDEPADVAVVVVPDPAVGLGPVLAALRAECQDLRLRCIVAPTGADRAPRPEVLLERDVILAPAAPDRGHAASINAARAHLGSADAVLVLDGTCVVERGALGAMVDRMNRVGAGAVMPRLVTADGAARPHLRKQPSVTRAFLGPATETDEPGPGGRFSAIDTDPESYAHAHQVRWGLDTGLLVRRDVVDRIGDRDERMVTRAEVSDYVRRVRETGAPIWFEPAARIRHEPCREESPPQQAALGAENRVRYLRRHRSRGYALVFQTALALRAARHWTDPAQRRVLGTLLTGTALRSSAADAGRQTPGPEASAVAAGAGGPSPEPVGAVIIPAHNEHATIGRTLALLSPLATLNQAEVIVVCNGCSDNSASIARSFPGIEVFEIDTASKTAALNVGDTAARAWPRLYLDADVGIEPATVRAIFDALSAGPFLAARPTCAYDTTGASALVRSYFRARGRIPTNQTAIWGAGAYAVTAAGHERFETFPPVTADDSYIDSLFAASEKVVVPTLAPVRVYTPRTVSGLLAVLARQHRGATELGTASTTTGSIRALLASVRGPASAADVLCYAGLTVLGRVRTHRDLSRGRTGWERDLSSRVPPPEPAA